MKTPLYQTIYAQLKERILSGEWCLGAMLPPERALRDEFKVCHLTVRKALSRLVDERFIERRSGSGTFVLYEPSRLYARIQESQIQSATVILEELDSFFAGVVAELELQLAKAGISLSLHCHHRNPVLQRELCQRAAARDDTLLLLFPTGSDIEWISSLPALKRTVILDEYIPGLDTVQIMSEDIDGMYQATRYLAQLGHRKIAHIGARAKTSGTNREKGYLDAVREFGLVNDPGLIADGAFQKEPGAAACRQILEKHPDCLAFTCANDYSAFGAIEVFRGHNLQPGRDVSLIGYGNYEISDVLGLTSVDQRVHVIAEQVNACLQELRRAGSLSKRLVTVPVELKIRSSCTRA